jgi:thiamine-phosphate pyrophosphorylase
MALPVDFSLYLITDRQQTGGRPLVDVVEAALKGGVRAVQLREKDLNTKELYELAFELRKLTRQHGARLIINDRADIALAVDADGVHLGNSSLPIYRVRALVGPRKLIGVSCHNQLNVITAQEKGADFVTFGPVYYTPSKTIYGNPVGLDLLETVAGIGKIPVFALGGIKKQKLHEVLTRGANGVALVSAIMSADDPESAARELLSLIEQDLPPSS